MENPVRLPMDHKFTLYLDKEGNYVLESQQERGLLIRGATPDLVVMEMIEILQMGESFNAWCVKCGSPIESDPIETIMLTFENFQEMTWGDENESLVLKLKRAYSDPVFCREALMLNKEFEAAQLEVLSRSEP